MVRTIGYKFYTDQVPSCLCQMGNICISDRAKIRTYQPYVHNEDRETDGKGLEVGWGVAARLVDRRKDRKNKEHRSKHLEKECLAPENM